jgi:peptidylprolyl isomerase
MSRFRFWPLAALLASGLVLAACGGGAGSDPSSIATIASQDRSPAGAAGTAPTVTVPAGAPPKQLETADLIKGTGPAAKAGDTVTVQYVLATYSTRGVVQSSWTSMPFSFTLDAKPEQVIPGWDKGVTGMKVGGRRELIIPPSLGYGYLSPGPGIAKDDTLVFVVDLLAIN